MKSVWIFLVINTQCMVMCFIRGRNNTERFRRNGDDTQKISLGSYNERIESK